METLVDLVLEERYKSIKHLGYRLSEFSTLIDWESFRKVVGDIYRNQTEQGGRPNMDIIVMVKMWVLQSMYTLSDPELERQANDRISFMKFLDYPEKTRIKRRSGISGNSWQRQGRTKRFGKNSSANSMPSNTTPK